MNVLEQLEVKVISDISQTIQSVPNNQISEFQSLQSLSEELNISNINYSKFRPVRRRKHEDNPRKQVEVLFDNEARLLDFTNLIRTRWMDKCFARSKYLYKSPLFGTDETTLNGHEVNYRYERYIVRDYFSGTKTISMWNEINFCFSSGMMGIYCLLLTFERMFRNKNAQFLIASPYFETVQLFDFLNVQSSSFHYYLDDAPNFNQLNLSDFDVISVEPTMANVNLSEINLDDLINALNHEHRYLPQALILDETYLGPTFDYRAFLTKVKNKNLIVAAVRSALKLDQQGLEMVNAGLVRISVNKHNSKLLDALKEHIVTYMNVVGANPSFFEYCILDNDAFLNGSKDYAQRVSENAADLQRSLAGVRSHPGIITEIFPKVSSKAPFIYLKTFSDDEADYATLQMTIEKISTDLGQKIAARNSFGFRQASIEFFNAIQTNEHTFKISPGCFRGAQFQALLSTIKHINELSIKEYAMLRSEVMR